MIQINILTSTLGGRGVGGGRDSSKYQQMQTRRGGGGRGGHVNANVSI